MTVRAWFTITAIALALLSAAFVYRFFFQPVSPPQILVTTPDARLPGAYAGSCWPQRGDELRCEEPADPDPGESATITGSGTMRVIAAFPVQPDRGRLVIVDARSGREVLSERWTDRLAYDVPSGTYRLEAEARYPADAFVRYVFAFRVR